MIADVHLRAYERGVGRAAMDDLLRALPAGELGVRRTGFCLDAPWCTLKVRLAIKDLVDRGLRPCGLNESCLQAGTFGLQFTRGFGEHDLLAAKYLYLIPQRGLAYLSQDQGCAIVNVEELQTLDMYGPPTGNGPAIVPMRIVHALQHANLRAVKVQDVIPRRIKNVVVDGDEFPDEQPAEWQDVGETWCQLTSDVLMPPWTPNDYTRPVEVHSTLEGEAPWVLRVTEGHFLPHRMRCDRAAVEALPEFDVARPANSRGIYVPLVVSQRCFQVLRESGISMKPVPIHLEDETERNRVDAMPLREQ